MRSAAGFFYMIIMLVLCGCLPTIADQIETRPVDLAAPRPPLVEPTLGAGGTSAAASRATDLSGYAYSLQDQAESGLFAAEGLLNLTMEQAVFSALQRNRALAVEQFTPLIAGTFVDTEQAVFDPVLFAEGSFESYRDRSLDDISARFFSIDGSRSLVRTGVRKRFQTGTDVSLDLALRGSDNDASEYSDEMRAGLNLTQALLRDAGVAVNLVGVRQAETAALASSYSLRGFAESLVAAVEQAYWEYGLAVRQEEIFQESFQLAQRQREDVRTRISVGQIAETEETVVDAELALREQQLIDARSVRERRRLNLLRLMNPPSAEGWQRQITISENTVVPEVSLGSVMDHEALAMRLRPDLNEARLQARSGELETVQTKNGLLPRLDLFINIGKTGYSQSFSNSFTDLDGPGYDFTAGLDFEFPVYNRAAEARDRRARAGYQQALQSIENLKQLISLDVRTALLEVERSLQQIVAGGSRRILQEEVVRAETVRFGVGTATALDVARVQRDLLESRINEVEAIVNYRLALTDLYLLDGTLLLRRGIAGPGAEEVVLSSSAAAR
ncbi:MAG: TolC family protein [Desulfocapsaceae bacterium]|jgi:outer membrane protein TolC|nr:TolC family protein [Desulfocapsaceae bacterium]